jgi:homoserine dehydrogenase
MTGVLLVAKNGPVKVALMGAGVVGGGVIRILTDKFESYTRQLGQPLLLSKALVRDLTKHRPGVDPSILTRDASEILDDPEIDIVVEVMGGEQPALEYITRALMARKYVVTANKEVMAKHGAHLLSLAHANGVDILYEASVGGGIPIIAPLKRDLLANDIKGIAAIINGTTNYILTAMSREGADFLEVLRRAQDLGYAEADPANDVEGEDARYKLAILASLSFRTSVRPDDIYLEGITRLTARDFRYAYELGYAIKLLALAHGENSGIQARVHPAFVPVDEPLAKVDGVLNAVQVEGDLTGQVLFSGPGAGSFPTTSAVIADVLDAAQSILGGRRDVYYREEDTPPSIIPMSQVTTRYYIRLTVPDRPGVLARITAVLGDAMISISSIIQKEQDIDAQTAELVIMTHEAREESMQSALAALDKLDAVQAIGSFIRVEHL